MTKVMSLSRLCIGNGHLRAFTLVEVLVSLVLVSILSGMILTAVRGVTSTARQSRTRSIIAIIDSVIQEQYESYKYRPLPVVVPDTSFYPPNNLTTFGYEVMPSEGARVRLNMIRDLQRMELPDRATDILMPNNEINDPAEITTAVTPVVRNAAGRMVRETDKAQRRPAVVTWAPPAKLEQYRRRLLARTSVNLENDSAECLYMIMATSFIGGSPAISLVPSQNIGDTDNDGLPEVLDGWGRPIGFVRWPVGYTASFAEGAQFTDMPDDFDLMKSDFGWIVSEQTPTVADIANPWSVRPLVISAGSDGEFGIRFAPEDASENPVVLRYSNSTTVGVRMTWPIVNNYMGTESLGRTTQPYYVFVDPFFRNAQLFAGINLPASNNGDPSVQDDNITNYQVAVTE
jgi:prepilin-type N-terminal cleavage/methylation domain-containing protein